MKPAVIQGKRTVMHKLIRNKLNKKNINENRKDVSLKTFGGSSCETKWLIVPPSKPIPSEIMMRNY